MARDLRVLAWPKDVNAAHNAYTSLQYAQMTAAAPGVRVTQHRWSLHTLRATWDVWHVHWPEYYLNQSAARRWAGSLAVLLFATVFRLRGTKIVWTVHNLRPHEFAGARTIRLFYGVWTRLVHAVVHLTAAGADEALAAHPALRGKPALISRHGPYRVTQASARSRADARAAFGPAADDLLADDLAADLAAGNPLIGFVGAPRAYKGIDELRAAHAAIAADTGAVLLLAGARAADPAPSVQLLPGPLDVEQLETVMRACDLVVLPYRHILNSGSMIHVLCAGGRVLVPDFATLVESAGAVGAGTASFYSSAAGLQPDELRAALEHAAALPDAPALTLDAADQQWFEVTAALGAFYRQVCRAQSGHDGHQ